MKTLISVVSLEEAKIVAKSDTDILDVKNTAEGSLGAQNPVVLKEIAETFDFDNMLCSAALGDLAYKPGTAALAAFGAAHCGVKYVKPGLHGVSTYEQAFEMLDSIVKAVRMVGDDITVVACGYADFARFGGLNYKDLIRATVDAGADGAMLDTAIKDGKRLFDVLSIEEVQEFVDLSKKAGLLCALAGSIRKEDMATLAKIGPDIVGVRGAVCDSSDRTKGVTEDRLLEFLSLK